MSEGFDAGAFAAKISSIGHAGNLSGGGGGGLSLGGEIAGPMAGTAPGLAAGEVANSFNIVEGTAPFDMIGGNILTSLIKGSNSTIDSIINAPLSALGNLSAPIASPISTLPSPHQAFVSGGKGKG